VIAYFDTSAVVPLLIEESGSETATILWDSADRVFCCRLVYAEGRAALAMACRTGRLRAPDLRLAVDRLDDLYKQMAAVEISDALVRRAGELAEQHSLRGYDAVHLAAADTLPPEELVVVSGDVSLRRAAQEAGLAVATT
jgi:predicted nucleic acid-binding protein